MHDSQFIDRIDSALDFFQNQISLAPDIKLLELIDKGWEKFYRELFGDHIVDGYGSVETEDDFHRDAIKWHWDSRLALLAGERPPDDYFAWFPTWPRGFGKTSVARMMIVTEVLLRYAHGERSYNLIVGGTKNKVRSTALSIEKMLHDPKIVKWCPDLAKVEKNVAGHSRGWTADYIATRAGAIFHFIGLDEGVAGANVDDVRPTYVLLDDIDSREDSPTVSETRFRILTSEVLPTGQKDTLIFWAQNLISRYSVRYRIEKQHSKVMADRKKMDPVPAVRGLVTELVTLPDGRMQHKVRAGSVTWKFWDLQRVQDEINRIGLEAFLREMQHDVEQSNEGLLLHKWNDAIHVISESEFANAFHTKKGKMPVSWPKEWGNDWARTKTKYHANVSMWHTVSPYNAPEGFRGFNFYFYPSSYPANSQPEDVAEKLLSQLEDGPYEGTTWADLRRDELLRTDALRHTKTALEREEYERDALTTVFPRYTEKLLRRHNVLGGVMSHERDDIRKIYNTVYVLKAAGVNPKKFGGVEQMNRDLTVDYTVAHPFRPHQMGFTRTFVVVPDDEMATADDRGVRPPVPFVDATSPDELVHHDLLRHQFVNWRTRPATLTVTGEAIDDPEKLNDDFGNLVQMQQTQGPLKNAPLSVEEEYELILPNSARIADGEVVTIEKQRYMSIMHHLTRLQLRERHGDDVFEELEEAQYGQWLEEYEERLEQAQASY